MLTVRSVASQPALVQCGGKNALLYHRKRDSDAVKEAEDRGYFVTVNEEFIRRNAKETEIESERFLALNRLHIRHLDGLEICRSLTVLLLANNFIARIDALAPCSKLIKLDLHGNQISKLPDPSFWKGLRRLRVLHLHDNPIGKYRTIDSLSSCQSLTLLTLSDTPISVRRYYRHHVINTIWSLKALDRCVISDEEVIEGAKFGGRFSAQSEAFQLPSSVQKAVPESAAEAEASVWNLMGRVNSILAHHSPVLVIQRYWRGFLTRSAIRWAVETELWAAVTIQRRYREWKAGKRKSTIIIGPTTPPITPLCTNRCVRTPLSGKFDPSGRFDYESYLMSRRPLSSAFSRFSPLPGTRARPSSANIENVANVPNETISFDLAKLQMNVYQQLAKENQAKNAISEEPTTKARATNSKSSAQSNRPQTVVSKPKPRKVRSVKEFFGPVEIPDDNDDGDSPLANFRLRGIREEVKSCDIREDIIEERQNCARYIRLSDDVNHITTNARAKPKISRVPLTEIRERENRKYRSAIWLSCLNAIGKDYKRAEAAERSAQQAAHVRRLKETRDGARERIRAQVSDHQRRSAIISHIEQQGVFDDLQDRKLRSSHVALRYNVVRRRSAQFEKSRRSETEFASEFVGRTASCTKADFRFGEQEMREQRTRVKKDLVSDLREQTVDVRDIRRMFLGERLNQLQHDSLAERNELRKRISESMQEQILAAQNRVAQLRRAKTDVGSKPVLVLPIVGDPNSPPVRSHTCGEIDAR